MRSFYLFKSEQGIYYVQFSDENVHLGMTARSARHAVGTELVSMIKAIDLFRRAEKYPVIMCTRKLPASSFASAFFVEKLSDKDSPALILLMRSEAEIQRKELIERFRVFSCRAGRRVTEFSTSHTNQSFSDRFSNAPLILSILNDD